MKSFSAVAGDIGSFTEENGSAGFVEISAADLGVPKALLVGVSANTHSLLVLGVLR